MRGVIVCAAVSLLCACASAQDASCPKAEDMTHRHLMGLWRAEFEGLRQGATVLLEQHPSMEESVRGAINRNGERAEIAGDVDDGDVTLEESANGVNISATWLGTMEEGSCGRTIKGTWQGSNDAQARGFVLRRQPGSR